MNLRKTIVHGEKLPKGWGLAYINVNTATGECFPIPLNLLVRWGREIYFAIAWGKRRNFEKRAWDKGYEEGVKAGRRMESVYHKFSAKQLPKV